MMENADVQITTEGDACRLPSGAPSAAEILQQVQPPRLHTAATVRVSCSQGASAPELPSGGSAAAGFAAVVPRHWNAQGSGSQHAVSRISRVEPGPASAQAPGPTDAVVCNRQTTGIDGGDRFEPLRHSPPQPAL